MADVLLAALLAGDAAGGDRRGPSVRGAPRRARGRRLHGLQRPLHRPASRRPRRCTSRARARLRCVGGHDARAARRRRRGHARARGRGAAGARRSRVLPRRRPTASTTRPRARRSRTGRAGRTSNSACARTTSISERLLAELRGTEAPGPARGASGREVAHQPHDRGDRDVQHGRQRDGAQDHRDGESEQPREPALPVRSIRARAHVGGLGGRPLRLAEPGDRLEPVAHGEVVDGDAHTGRGEEDDQVTHAPGRVPPPMPCTRQPG